MVIAGFAISDSQGRDVNAPAVALPWECNLNSIGIGAVSLLLWQFVIFSTLQCISGDTIDPSEVCLCQRSNVLLQIANVTLT